MTKEKFEVEMRVRINENDEEALIRKIVSLGAVLVKEESQVDRYYKCEKDIERKLIIRIRDTEGKQRLTFKGSIKSDEGAWPEWENSIVDGDHLAKLFLQNGYCEVVVIDKKRRTYKLNNFEINIDKIKDLGTFVEVELMHENIKEANEIIEDFLKNQIGILIKNIVKKGYVPLMIEKKKGQIKIM